MIETDFFILSKEQFTEYTEIAFEHGTTIDYYLMEFCDVEGPNVYVD